MNKEDYVGIIFGLIIFSLFLGGIYHRDMKLEENKHNLGSKLCNFIDKNMTDLRDDLTAVECDYEVYPLTIDYEYDKWSKPTNTRLYCIGERSSQIAYCYAE